jgi:myo-inositol-1(or 4)-monophosphatase
MKMQSIKPRQMSLNRHCAEESRWHDLERIQIALDAAGSLLLRYYCAGVTTEFKSAGDPVTAADRAVDQLLSEMLPKNGEGWLSEESINDPSRLNRERVWVVDPLDGTREFIAGVPEWSVSIGLVENGQAVAGGVCNPATGEVILGSLETGIVVCADATAAFSRTEDQTPWVLASRSEVKRGEWNCFEEAPFFIRPIGSVAYKLALVAAGFADATWTFVPKHEWDVTAGIALVLAGGGVVTTLDGKAPVFNRPEPLLEGLIAVSAKGQKLYGELLDKWVMQGRKAGA